MAKVYCSCSIYSNISHLDKFFTNEGNVEAENASQQDMECGMATEKHIVILTL